MGLHKEMPQKGLQKILIVGNGGREYALGAHVRADSRVGSVYFAPGNAGTAALGVNLPISQSKDLVRFCQDEQIDWVIIGGESALVSGLSDELRASGIKTFGPSRAAAQLEGSKAFMKDFVASCNIPTARYIQTQSPQAAIDFARSLPLPVVIKASGLCAGKGVIIAESYEEAESSIAGMLSGESFGEAGRSVVVEEFLRGYELSVFGICDGDGFKLLPACQDHKQLYDNDKGPNTGGMGAYTPSPLCDEILLEKIATRIFAPTLAGMKVRGTPFSGVLFAGIMVVGGEPYLLEFNVRFGDPECEVLMPLLETPLLDICEAVESKRIASLDVRFKQGFCVGVVLASHNYPFGSSTPYPISLKPFDSALGSVCFAGVSQTSAEQSADKSIDKSAESSTTESSLDSSDSCPESHTGMLASGGRVALAIGVAPTLAKAQQNAYKIAECIQFEGKVFRTDIADKALKPHALHAKDLDSKPLDSSANSPISK